MPTPKKSPKPEAPTFIEMMSGMMESLRTGKIPEGDSFQECLTRSALALLDEYVLRDSPFTAEIDRLVRAFQNRKDPFISSLGLMEHAAVWAVLNQIRVRREQRRESEKGNV